MKTSTKIWLCLSGCALVLLGVLCIMYPGDTLVSLAWVFGLILVVAGFGTFGTWAALRRLNPFSGLTFLTALLHVFLGIVIIVMPAPLAVALPFIFAFWVFYEGLSLLLDSFNYKRFGFSKWWILSLLGVLAMCGGCYSLFCNPAVSAKIIAWLVGLAIIADGIGNWIKVLAVSRVEKRLNKLAERLDQVLDIEDVEAEEVK